MGTRAVALLVAVALALAVVPAQRTYSQVSLEEVEARSFDIAVEILPVPMPTINSQLIRDFQAGLPIPSGTLKGRATMVIEATAPYDVSTVRMEFWRGLTIKSLKAEGYSVNVARAGDSLTLTFSPALKPKARVSLALEFDGSSFPIWNEFTFLAQGEIYPLLVSPFGDFNANRGSIKAEFTAPAAMTIVSSGRLVDVSESGGRKTWRFQSEADLESFPLLGGNYEKRTVQIGEYPLDVYYKRGQTLNLDKTINLLAKAIEWQGQYLYQLPFRRMQMITFPYDWFGAAGIAWPGVMMIADAVFTERLRKEYQRDSFYLVLTAHEAAHNFWGIEVQAKGRGWQCIWECFAEYTAQLTVEGVLGQKASETELQELRDAYALIAGRERAISDYYFTNAGTTDAIIVRYNKGPLVLHMLRYVMGNTKFQQFFASLAKDNRGNAIRLETVQEYAERAYGSTLDWFFQEWFYSVVLPDYQIAGVTSVPDGTGFKVTATLRNTGTGSMPVEVGFVQDDGKVVTATVTIGPKEDKPVTVTIERRVTKVVADPGRWLLQSDYKNDEFTVPR